MGKHPPLPQNHSIRERTAGLTLRGLLVLAAMAAIVGCGSSGQIEELLDSTTVVQRKVYVDVTSLTLVEGSAAVINVALTEKSDKDSVVQLMMYGAAGRFQPVPVSLTIPKGSLSKAVVLQTINNSIYEGNSQFQFVVSSFDSTLAVDAGRLDINLVDDDLPPTISIAGATVSEAAGTVSLTVSLSAASGLPTSFTWSTSDGTAIAPGDYSTRTAIAGSIAAGATSTTISIPISNDIAVEASETFSVAVGNLVGATAGTVTGTVTITDDDVLPTISVAGVTVAESAGTATLTVTISAVSATNTTFNWSTSNGTAVAPGDFTAQTTIAGSIAAGATTTTISVPIIDDATVEPSETFTVTLSGLVGATAGTLSDTVTITDDDVLPPLLSINNETTSERSTNLIFTVALNGVQLSSVSIDYVSSNGTAIAGTDFTSVTGTATIPAGQTSATISVPLIYRSGSQGDRSFTLTFSNPVNTGLSNATATGTISDGFFVAPHLVKEIGIAPIASDYFKVAGGKVFFTNYDVTNGTELWVSDGTNGGTMLVKDIRPGSSSSAIYEMVNFGGILFFTANDGVNGRELWRSDGTAVGTYLVKDTLSGVGGGDPINFYVWNGKMYFEADTTGGYRQLWVSDGTAGGTAPMGDYSLTTPLVGYGTNIVFGAYDIAAGTWDQLYISDGTAVGTTMVKNLNASGAQINEMVSSNGLLFFQANGSTGREPYVSDGTAGGTNLLLEIGTSSSNAGFSTPKNFTPAGGGKTYFKASDGNTYGSSQFLFVSDGTTGGTAQMTANTVFCSTLMTLGSQAIFLGIDSANSNDTELWVSDGTVGGTARLKDIYPGSISSNISLLGKVGSYILFLATDGVNGRELWRTDGTSVGTVMVKDINPGSAGSGISGFTTDGTTAWFIANDGTSGVELWKSDGSNAGTVMVKDIFPGAGPSSPRSLTSFGSGLFFLAYDSTTSKAEVGFSDGTSVGTSLFPAAQVQTVNATISDMTGLGSKIYFSADNGTGGSQLWESDNTTGGTQLVKDIMPDSGCSGIKYLKNINSSLFFVTKVENKGVEPILSDGTSAGTGIIKDILAGPTGSEDSLPGATSIMAFGSKIFFSADSGQGIEPYVTDGTSAGTIYLGNLNNTVTSGVPIGSSPLPIGMIGTKMLFKATGNSVGQELWTTDGTAVGTQVVKDIYPGTNGGYIGTGAFLGSTYIFYGSEPTNGGELWKTDGTNAGTVMVMDINPGSASSSPQALKVFGTKMLFYANNGVNGYEPWITDGTLAGTNMIKDINPGAASSNVSPSSSFVYATATAAFFTATDGVNGTELWRTDGTDAGTFMVKDITAGAGSTTIALFGISGSRLVFRVYNGATYDLWSTDGTTSGTYSIQPAAITNMVSAMTSLGGILYFSAPTAAEGNELWRTDGTVNGTYMISDTVPGTGDFLVSSFYMWNGVIYMYASENSMDGYELWSFSP
jgi:trimeric autotransporter adhesin